MGKFNFFKKKNSNIESKINSEISSSQKKNEMKILTIEETAEIPSEKELTTFFKNNNINIPDDYFHFLLTQNPYTIEEVIYNLNGKVYVFQEFSPFDSANEYSLQNSIKECSEMLENKYISFANDPAGNLYVLRIINDSNFGKVYFFRLDSESTENIPLLANSFSEFINGLEEE